MSDRLDEIQKAVDAGETPEVIVRELLRWYGQERRGSGVVFRIRRDLSKRKLKTIPDFTEVWIDGEVTFVTTAPRPASTRGSDKKSSSKSGQAASPPPPRPQLPHHDGVYRIGRLTSANSGVESVPPGTPLDRAVTKMLTQGYSQLPVMKSGDRDCTRAITWKSVAERLAMGQKAEHVDDCVVEVKTLDADTSLIEAIPDVIAVGFVLVRVREKGNAIMGIVTTADLSDQFKTISEPFLLIGQIENLLRVLIDASFGPDDIQAATPGGLSLGDYVRLLENPEQWKKLKSPGRLDRAEFIDSLKEVKEIRNDVMHFNNRDPLSSQQLGRLRAFASFLEQAAR